jgi:hypothetical protein
MSPELAPFSFANPRSWTATGIQTSSNGATITVNARGNLGSAAKFLSLKIDGVTLATNIFGSGSGATNCAASLSTATFTIPPAQFLKLTTDGELEVRIEPSLNATSAGCSAATLTVTLNYNRDIIDCDANGLDDECDVAISPATSDCNNNLLIDSCEIAQGATDINLNGRLDTCEIDCNGNSLPDTYELANNLVPDCNSNARPDSCDVAVGGGSNDVDRNGIPDECKADCNNNYLPDAWEISQNMVQDCNHNAIPDSCDIATNPAIDCNNSGSIDACDIAAGTAIDCNLNGKPDSCDITAGAEDDNQNGKLDSCELLYGDLNLDGHINGADLGAMLGVWGFPNPPYGDLNGDHIASGADLGILLGRCGVVN